MDVFHAHRELGSDCRAFVQAVADLDREPDLQPTAARRQPQLENPPVPKALSYTQPVSKSRLERFRPAADIFP